MDNKIKLKLLDEVEIQVVGILLERGICEYIRSPATNSNKASINSFSNITLTGKYREIFNVEAVSEEFVRKYRELFPVSRNGSVKTISVKLERFLNEYPQYSLQNIYDATQRYIEYQLHTSGETHIFNADNIIYKKEPGRGGAERIAILNILETYGEHGSTMGDNSDGNSSMGSGSSTEKIVDIL